MREGWAARPCGTILELGKPGIWGNDDPGPGDKPFYCLRGVDIASLRDGGVPEAPLRYTAPTKLQSKKCTPGSLLIETSGSKCGRSVLMTSDRLEAFAKPVAYSNFCRSLIPDIETVTIEFAALWLDWMYVSDVLPSWRAASAMPNLDLKGFLGGQMMMIPPLDEQRRIVDLIGSLDATITATDQAVAKAEQARRAVLTDLLAPPSVAAQSATAEGPVRPAMREEWSEIALGDGARVDVGPAFKSAMFTEAADDVRLVRGINVGPGSLRWADTKRLPAEAAQEFTRYALTPLDCLIAMDATFTSQGSIRAATVTATDLPALLVQRVARLRAGDHFHPEYLALVIQSVPFARHLRARQTGAFAPHISLTDIRTYRFELPPLDEQQQIVDIISTLDDEVAALKSTAGTARAMRAGLLSELLSGNHEIPSTYDRLLEAA